VTNFRFGILTRRSFVRKEKLSERFNCFLSKQQITYLEKKALNEQISRSEYVRRLLEEDMNASDLRIHHQK
jgi:hypothetical protein